MSFSRRLPQRHRFFLMALSLALGTLAYWVTGVQISSKVGVTVQIHDTDVINLPAGYVLTAISPREIQFQVSGPQNALRRLGEGDLRARLSIGAQSLTEGQQRFDVTPSLFGLGPDLTIANPSNPVVTVAFSPVVTRSLPLAERPELLNRPEGIGVEVRLSRSQVRVEGPLAAVGALEGRRIPLAPLDLALVAPGLTEAQELPPLPLLPQVPPGVRVLDGGAELYATVKVTPVPQSLTVGPLPILTLGSPEVLAHYDVEISPPVLALGISGPRNLLADPALATQIIPYVDVSTINSFDLPQERPVRVLAPRWATVSGATVRVTLKTRGADLTPAPPPLPPDGDNAPPLGP